MSEDVLSQQEIDNLLSALSSGDMKVEEIKEEEKEHSVKVYDFKRPDKFSKEQIRTLVMMHENFSRLVATYLSAHLRTRVNIEVASVDQLTYDEFVRSVASPTLLGIFSMEPLMGNSIIEINLELGFSMIERLFGGGGRPYEEKRNLTDIERNVLKHMLKRILAYFSESWVNVASFQAELEKIETNLQFVQIVSPGDMVVLLTFKAEVGEAKGFINICIPIVAMEPLIPKLSAQYWFAAAAVRNNEESQNIDVLRQRIEKALVLVKVQLGNSVVTVEELLNLQRGDVLPLDKGTDEDLDIIIGERKKFTAKAGLVGGKLAVQIMTPSQNQGVEREDE